MPEPENRKVVEDAAALAELERFEELQERAVEMGEEIRSLLAPLKDQLQALVVEYDFLYYEALVARFKFFQAAKKADISLVGHNSMRFERVGDKVYMRAQTGMSAPPSKHQESILGRGPPQAGKHSCLRAKKKSRTLAGPAPFVVEA